MTAFGVFWAPSNRGGTRCSLHLPLHQGEKRLGALDLYRDTPGLLDEEGMVTAQTLADVTSTYLVNAQARADLQDSSDRSRESSLHDALTGLPNRVLLIERLRHSLIRGSRTGQEMAILFADLDRFKLVNDTHGHPVGDELLVAVAKRLVGLLRPGDTLARLSGDEFVMLCEDLDEEAEADLIASRVVDALSAPFELSGIVVEISASVGIAFTGIGEQIPEQLLKDADIAMYQSKRKGGHGHQVLDLREQRLAQRQVSLKFDLSGAIRRGELRAEYQPIVRTKDGRIVSVEALLRWDHAIRGPIPPKVIILLAEQSGLISEIGRWVLHQACTDRHGWTSEAGYDDIAIAVNVSAQQLMRPDFLAMVKGASADTPTRPELLTLEITENVFVQDSERALIVLNDLKQLGVVLALDDFGTGYSSLSYLQRFPVDIVKIDQGLIADLLRDQTSKIIVAAVIALAHNLGMSVIVEGVETAAQRDQVAVLGGEFCQGFYFARPMSTATFATLTN